MSASSQLAILAATRDLPAEGIVHMERALGAAEQVFGTDSPAIVGTLALLGKFYVVTNRTKDAEQVVGRITALIGENPPELSPGYLGFLQLQGFLASDRGDVDGAEALFKRTIAFSIKYAGPMAPAIGADQYNLALAYLRAERFSDAVASFDSALKILQAQNGPHGVIVGYVLLADAAAYAGIGDRTRAEELRLAAVKILGPALSSRPMPRWL
jgi:tetratricopeptide (TPR) repeat protein